MSPGLILCLSRLPTALGGAGSGADGLSSCSCPLSPLSCLLTFLPWPLRTVMPLPGVLPGALPCEAVAPGSGLAGLAVSP